MDAADSWSECEAEHPRYVAKCTQLKGHEGPHVDVDAFIQWEDKA
jgi:hypothetical protein